MSPSRSRLRRLRFPTLVAILCALPIGLLGGAPNSSHRYSATDGNRSRSSRPVPTAWARSSGFSGAWSWPLRAWPTPPGS